MGFFHFFSKEAPVFVEGGGACTMVQWPVQVCLLTIVEIIFMFD